MRWWLGLERRITNLMIRVAVATGRLGDNSGAKTEDETKIKMRHQALCWIGYFLFAALDGLLACLLSACMCVRVGKSCKDKLDLYLYVWSFVSFYAVSFDVSVCL